jgi:hypothetical protein
MHSEDKFSGGDWEWLAVDAEGHVGVFTVAGGVPMPEAFRDLDLLERVSGFISSLPVRSEAELIVELPRPDDYVAFAERGLYAYDWTDFHRVRPNHIRQYEMQARPRTPRRLVDLALPSDIQAAIWIANDLVFGSSMRVTVPRVGFQW